MSNNNIRILVADDHESVRNNVIALLEREPDLEVVGAATNGVEAVALAQLTDPDVIVMDVSMPILDGIRASGQIKALGITARIIILSLHHSNALQQQARKNGVSGYISKQQATVELLPAIRAAAANTLSF